MPWINGEGCARTWSQRYVSVIDPDPRDVVIVDVAHSLARIPRFGGHCNRHYSVAQHSVLVSQIVPRRMALHGLLHDAAEYLLDDIKGPLKREIMHCFGPIEEHVEAVIFAKFGIPTPWPDDVRQDVKYADLVALSTEARDVMGVDDPLDPEQWGAPYPPLPTRIRPWKFRRARRRFLKRFQELYDEEWRLSGL